MDNSLVNVTSEESAEKCSHPGMYGDSIPLITLVLISEYLWGHRETASFPFPFVQSPCVSHGILFSQKYPVSILVGISVCIDDMYLFEERGY